MVSSIKKQLNPKNFKEQQLNKSAGILDDFAVRKTVNSMEGYFKKIIINEPSDVASPLCLSTNTQSSTAGNLIEVKYQGNLKFSVDDGGWANITQGVKFDATNYWDVDEFVTDGDFFLTGLNEGGLMFLGAGGEVLEDNANLFWDNTNKRLGIGTATPESQLHIAENTGAVYASLLSGTTPRQLITGDGQNIISTIVQASSSATQRPILQFRKARGTIASPTTVANNDQLASFGSGGYTGTSVVFASEIDFYVDGAVTATTVPTRISFVTGTTAGDRTERMVIKNDGKVGIGDTAPNQLLGIKGTNAQISIEESNTEFVRIGVGETAGTSVIGWDDSDILHLGVYSSPTDTTINSHMTISSGGAVDVVNALTAGNITSDSTITATTALQGATVKATNIAGFISSDGSTGWSGTFLVNGGVNTVTVKDGIITAVV